MITNNDAISVPSNKTSENIVQSRKILSQFFNNHVSNRISIDVGQLIAPKYYMYACFVIDWQTVRKSYPFESSLIVVVCDNETNPWYIAEQAMIQIETILAHTGQESVYDAWADYTIQSEPFNIESGQV